MLFLQSELSFAFPALDKGGKLNISSGSLVLYHIDKFFSSRRTLTNNWFFSSKGSNYVPHSRVFLLQQLQCERLLFCDGPWTSCGTLWQRESLQRYSRECFHLVAFCQSWMNVMSLRKASVWDVILWAFLACHWKKVMWLQMLWSSLARWCPVKSHSAHVCWNELWLVGPFSTDINRKSGLEQMRKCCYQFIVFFYWFRIVGFSWQPFIYVILTII